MITEYDFNLAQGSNCWKRVGDMHPVNLYYGKDDDGLNAIEFSGKFEVNRRITSSIVIKITHYSNNDGTKSIVFSLLDDRLLHPFCDFLNSMVDVTGPIVYSEQAAYKSICEVYFVMQKMFRPCNDILPEKEIKGLIGELLFLRDKMIPEFGYQKAIDSWSGSEKTRKDFSINNDWFEIKTIDFGKESVHISSIEQLDSTIVGNLIIYQVEKMAIEYDGLTLNKLVSSIFNMIPDMSDRDILMDKLYNAKYSYNSKYDDFVYEVRSMDTYQVRDNFPRICRANIPSAISKASFDLTISEILPFKL